MVTLNQLYLLKKLDLFSHDVKLRLQRSKEGNASDEKIGSWFGLFLSFCLVVLLGMLMGTKWADMNSYNNT